MKNISVVLYRHCTAFQSQTSLLCRVAQLESTFSTRTTPCWDRLWAIGMWRFVVPWYLPYPDALRHILTQLFSTFRSPQVILEALKLRSMEVSQHIRSNAARPAQVSEALEVLRATLGGPSSGGGCGGGSGGGRAVVEGAVVGIIVHMPGPFRWLHGGHWLALAPRGPGGAWLNFDSKLPAPKLVLATARDCNSNPGSSGGGGCVAEEGGSLGALVAFLEAAVAVQGVQAFVVARVAPPQERAAAGGDAAGAGPVPSPGRSPDAGADARAAALGRQAPDDDFFNAGTAGLPASSPALQRAASAGEGFEDAAGAPVGEQLLETAGGAL